MTRTQLFWLAAAVCTVACFGARAQDVQTPASPTVAPGASNTSGEPGEDAASMGTLDTNKDGQLTKAEAKADPELVRRFVTLDRDNSGKLDQGEFARFEIGAQTSGSDDRTRGGVTAPSDSDAAGNDPARDRTRDR